MDALPERVATNIREACSSRACWCCVLLSLAGLVMAGRRIACPMTSVLGLGMMILAVFDPGMPFIAIWLIGVLCPTIGLSGWLASAR